MNMNKPDSTVLEQILGHVTLTFRSSGSHESSVSDLTLELWTPKLLQDTS